jgi:sulfhydrogenase subunit beta (sulfur reductase)
MKTLRLPKERLEAFTEVLGGFGQVHAPLRTDKGLAFGRLERWSDAELEYTRTTLPPKKYVLPQRETLFRYDPDAGYLPETEEPRERIILLGVHVCDIYGLNLLDKVFLGGTTDPYYRARRRNVAVVGIDCVPDEHCFCRSMRADMVDTGFDLFLCDIGEHYMVVVGTALGDDMVLAAPELFEEVEDADVEGYKRRSSEKERELLLDVDIRGLAELFDLEYDSAVWEELGERCLSCGKCTMVCPTCYCYDVRDERTFGEEGSTRLRVWDSCLFSQHAAVAGGENFRETNADRIKYRFYHKHRGFVVEHGRPSCIGCGRCIVSCPAGIHDVDVMNKLRGVSHAGA